MREGAEGYQNERPRNFRLVYRKLSGINMHERTLGNKIEMKSWRAEKRNSLHGRSYPRRESCLLSCRVVGKYEGYLIGAHAIYIAMAYMPNRKKGLRLKKNETLSFSLSVCQTLFRMAFSCIWLCGSLIKIKLFISATPAGLYSA